MSAQPPPPANPLVLSRLERLNEVIDGTLVDVGAFRAVFERIERDYGEAMRALDRALERLHELTEVRDALVAAQRELTASAEPVSEPRHAPSSPSAPERGSNRD